MVSLGTADSTTKILCQTIDTSQIQNKCCIKPLNEQFMSNSVIIHIVTNMHCKKSYSNYSKNLLNSQQFVLLIYIHISCNVTVILYVIHLVVFHFNNCFFLSFWVLVVYVVVLNYILCC